VLLFNSNDAAKVNKQVAMSKPFNVDSAQL